MSDSVVLENEIQQLWDVAQTSLAASKIELAPAIRLVADLRYCAERAHEAGYIGGEGQLRKAADELEARIRAQTG